jgi:hypothetical protein
VKGKGIGTPVSLGLVRQATRLGALAILLAVAGCGQPSATGSPSPGSSTGSSASASASPSPTPLFAFPAASGVTCPDLASLGLTRALLRPTDANRRNVALCDAHELAHPRILTPMGGSTSASFLSRDVIGYAINSGTPTSTPDQDTYAVRTLNLVTGQATDVATGQGVDLALGWSRDQSMVAYFTDTGSVHHWWLKRGSAAPVALVPAISFGGRGGSPDDELLVAFSPDGQYVAFVDTFVARLQIFRTADGVAVYTAPSGGAGGFRTMGTWVHNGDTFYFRNNSGVYDWDSVHGIGTFLPGVHWSNPDFSGSDATVAYSVTAADGTPHVEARSLSNGSVVATPAWRAVAAFLSENIILTEVEQACPPDSICNGYVPAGKNAVFHLDTHADASLSTPGWIVASFWPRA